MLMFVSYWVLAFVSDGDGGGVGGGGSILSTYTMKMNKLYFYLHFYN